MRNLSVVAILLGISAACSNQPAAPAPLPTGSEPKAAASVPASPRLLLRRTRSRSHPGRPGRRRRRCGVKIQLREQMKRFHGIAFSCFSARGIDLALGW